MPSSGQGASECAVWPGIAPTGDKRACYSVAERISADFNDESSMRARTRNVV